jgi:hypothetical protein
MYASSELANSEQIRDTIRKVFLERLGGKVLIVEV